MIPSIPKTTAVKLQYLAFFALHTAPSLFPSSYAESTCKYITSLNILLNQNWSYKNYRNKKTINVISWYLQHVNWIRLIWIQVKSFYVIVERVYSTCSLRALLASDSQSAVVFFCSSVVFIGSKDSRILLVLLSVGYQGDRMVNCV